MPLNNFFFTNIKSKKMKIVQYIMLPVLTGLLFVACNTEPKGPSQAELDTQVEVKVKLATDQLKADCDSRINQAAQAQADSLLAAAKPTAKPVTKPITPAQPIKAAPATPKVTETPAPPVKSNPKTDRFNNNGGKTVTPEDSKSKTDRFENGGKKEVTPEDTKKKADRFKK